MGTLACWAIFRAATLSPSWSRISGLGPTNVIPAEATRFYQVFYRDPEPNFCPSPPGGTFNVSNGLRVVWGA